MTRRARVAGSFYEADPGACRRGAGDLLDRAALPGDLPGVLYGGLVPHAGWVFSGETAAMTLKALAERGRLKRVVLFGADHAGLADGAAVYDRGDWATPLGNVPIDEELAGALLGSCPLLHAEPDAHAREHSLEVQLPLMQALGAARIVPINVSPSRDSAEVGRQVGAVLKSRFPDAGVIGSTDLTHYGPQYGFTPAGVGQAGLAWAQTNDRRLIRLIEGMRADEVVEETARHLNACGGGAIAATIAACSELGATRGICLKYTTSAEVMRQAFHSRSDDAVGYAAVVFA